MNILNKRAVFNYLLAAILIVLVVLLSSFSGSIYEFFNRNNEESQGIIIFFTISFLFILFGLTFYCSHLVKVPSFILAIIFGLAAKPFLDPVTSHGSLVSFLVGFGATYILFAGGLEVPFKRFRKIFWPIIALSFLGVFITGFLFSHSLLFVSNLFGTSISLVSAILLGALLSATDPAAIIPLIKNFRFKNHFVKDLVISESAVNDVIGTLATKTFLIMITGSVGMLVTVNHYYADIFSKESTIFLFKEVVFGIFFGLLGYALLGAFHYFKNLKKEEFEADAALFLAIPVLIFAVTSSFEGSGYLAAFIAGLFFQLSKHLHKTENFFNHLVETFLKPIIFILLGSLIDIGSLLQYAGVGLLISFIFMFIIRPIAVFVSLGGFSFKRQDKFSFKELIFVSLVRETGAIPAVLLATIASLNLPGTEGLVEIGMWVILSTLIVGPLLTPWAIKRLRIGELIVDSSDIVLKPSPLVILATRGNQFLRRLDKVLIWAKKHRVNTIMVLLCLESKYTPELEKQLQDRANKAFKAINESLRQKNQEEIEFIFMSRKGSLHANIERLSKEDANVTAMFVGKKMLDYHLGEIKNMTIPFYFLD